MHHAFSIKEAILFGWEKVKAHSGLVFGVVLTMFGLQVASSVVQKVLQDTLVGAAASIVLTVLGIVLGAGMTLIFLKLAKGESAHYRDIVPKPVLVWKYFCVSLLAGIVAFLPIMAAGLIDLVLLSSTGVLTFSEAAPAIEVGPAIIAAVLIGLVGLACSVYLSLRYSMARIAALDGQGINESMHRSAKLTHGAKGSLLLLVLALLAVNLLGLIALVVGLLVSIPVSLFAFLHVYLKLKGHHGH